MSQIGISFGTDTGSTRLVARTIFKQLGEELAGKPNNINRIRAAELLQYDTLILGRPSYVIGELPGLSCGCLEHNWQEFVTASTRPANVSNYLVWAIRNGMRTVSQAH